MIAPGGRRSRAQAEQLRDQLLDCITWDGKSGVIIWTLKPRALNIIEHALEAAVQEEREACLAIAEGMRAKHQRADEALSTLPGKTDKQLAQLCRDRTRWAAEIADQIRARRDPASGAGEENTP